MTKLHLLGVTAVLGSSIAAASFNPGSRDDFSTPTNTERFRGALSGLQAPAYDGPVGWVREDPVQKGGAAILFGIAGVVGALALTGVPRTDSSLGTKGIALGCAAIGGIGLGAVGAATAIDPYRWVTFDTTVSAVANEVHQSGQKNEEGYHDRKLNQAITIPESDVPLFVPSGRSPLMIGDHITVRIGVSEKDQRILFWYAMPPGAGRQ